MRFSVCEGALLGSSILTAVAGKFLAVKSYIYMSNMRAREMPRGLVVVLLLKTLVPTKDIFLEYVKYRVARRETLKRYLLLAEDRAAAKKAQAGTLNNLRRHLSSVYKRIDLLRLVFLNAIHSAYLMFIVCNELGCLILISTLIEISLDNVIKMLNKESIRRVKQKENACEDRIDQLVMDTTALDALPRERGEEEGSVVREERCARSVGMFVATLDDSLRIKKRRVLTTVASNIVSKMLFSIYIFGVALLIYTSENKVFLLSVFLMMSKKIEKVGTVLSKIYSELGEVQADTKH